MTDDGSRDAGAGQERAGQERAGQERAGQDDVSDGGAGQDKMIESAQPASDDPIAAEMAALFAVALSDEPPSRVSPLPVIAEARRGRAIGAHRRRTWLVGVAAAAVLVSAGVVVVPRMLSDSGSATAGGSPMAVVAASGVAGSTSAAAASSAAAAAAPEGASQGDAAGAPSTPTTVAQADSGGGRAPDASGPAGGDGHSVAAGTAAAGEGKADTARAPGSAPATSAASSAEPAGCAWTELGSDAVAAARAALPAGVVDHAASLSGPCDPAAVAGAVLVPAGTAQGGTASSGLGPVAGITVTITREGPGACLHYPADGLCAPTAAPDAFDVGTRQVFVYAGGLQARLDLDPAVGEHQPTVQQLAAAGRAVLATFG